MSADREIVQAPDAPAAIGPYSHAVRSGGMLVCSGQIPLDPVTGELVGATAAEQAGRCLQNLEAVCIAGGTTLQRALRLTIYMTDLGDFAEVNEIKVVWSDIKKASNEALVNGLSMMSPCGPREKQALLEARDLKSRAEMLVAITTIELARGQDAAMQIH